MATQYTSSAIEIRKFATSAQFPISGSNGQLVEDLSTHTLYAYDPGVPGWVAIASPGAAIGIDGLTGDVSASGPGVVPATVNSVGGSTAAQVHQSVLDTLAATSADTVSTLAKRDSAGALAVSTLTSDSYITSLWNSSYPPINLSTNSTSTAGMNGVTVSGRFAYVCLSNAFQIWDVYQRSAPVLLSTLALTSGATFGCIVAGSYAYLACTGTTNIVIIDISNPYAPTAAFTSSNPSATLNNTQALYGKYWYVCDQTNANILTYDISVPTAPVLVSTVAVGTTLPIAGVVQDGYLYVACNSGKLVVFSLTDPTTPSLVSSTTTGNSLTCIDINGTVVVLGRTSAGAIELWNVGNPAAPTQIGTSFSLGSQLRVGYIYGRYYYSIGKITSGNIIQLCVTDIAIASAPVKIATYNMGVSGISGNAARAVFVYGQIAYLGASASGNASFETVQLKGADIKSALIHSLEVGYLGVDKQLTVSGPLSASTSLLVGNGGVYSRGAIATSAGLVGTSLQGGTTAGGSLSLSSTSNATKGAVFVQDGSLLIASTNTSTADNTPLVGFATAITCASSGDASAGGLSVMQCSNGTGNTSAALFMVGGNGTFTSPTYVTQDQFIGIIEVDGSSPDGLGTYTAGRMLVQANQDHSDSNRGSNLIFERTLQDQASQSQALVLDADGNAYFAGAIGVGNSEAASVAVGTLAKKIEIFDASGNSLGFIPVYDSIT